MWQVHSRSWFDVDLRPQGQIHRLLSFLHVQPVTCFDIDIPYLAHGSITMRGCVKYIHDPNMTLTFDLKVKFIGFMTWFCVQASAYLSFDIVILECITMVRCVTYMYIYELCMTLTDDLNIRIIFSPWIWQDVFSLWHRHTKFWHMGISPGDNMLCPFLDLSMTLTFDLYVGSGGGGYSLGSFTHGFFLFAFGRVHHVFSPRVLVRDIYCFENYIYLRY